MARSKLVRFVASCAGVGRARAMALIAGGSVSVNGKQVADATLEVEVPRDRVSVAGRPLRPLPQLHFVMYKPRAAVCTREDPEGRRTVHAFLKPAHARAQTVGRLDYNTTGAILLTTDGELARALMLPGAAAREYLVKLKGPVTDSALAQWRAGLVIDGRKRLGADVRVFEREGDKAKVLVTLREGPNRIIHRMAEATSMRVMKIHRLKYAGIGIGGLQPGQYRPLMPPEVRHLYNVAEGAGRGRNTARGRQKVELPQGVDTPPARWRGHPPHGGDCPPVSPRRLRRHPPAGGDTQRRGPRKR